MLWGRQRYKGEGNSGWQTNNFAPWPWFQRVASGWKKFTADLDA